MIRKALFAALLPFAACMHAPAQDAQQPLPEPHEIPGPAEGVFPSMMRMSGDVIGVEGQSIGTLNLIGGPNGVLMEVTIAEGGLAPGWHGLHLHQVGDCSDLGVFKKSGGHLGLVKGGHGLLNPNGPEGGDLPNIWAAADGSAGYEAFSTLFSLADLADEDGAALIIHENRDDHMTQPIGGAGPRVACSVVK